MTRGKEQASNSPVSNSEHIALLYRCLIVMSTCIRESKLCIERFVWKKIVTSFHYLPAGGECCSQIILWFYCNNINILICWGVLYFIQLIWILKLWACPRLSYSITRICNKLYASLVYSMTSKRRRICHPKIYHFDMIILS